MTVSPEQRHHSPEPQQPTEFLVSKDTTGAQAFVLLGRDYPQPGMPPPTLDPSDINNVIQHGLDPTYRDKLKNASLYEREKHWERTPETQRMDIWLEETNAFLASYTTDPAKETEQTFFKNLLQVNSLEDVTALRLYDTFMRGADGGDLEYFARRIVGTNPMAEIGKNTDVIRKLAGMYGENSKEFAKLLPFAISNAQENAEAFVQSAQENISRGDIDDPSVWERLEANAAEWQRPQEPQPSQEAEYLAEGGVSGAGESTKGTHAENEDRFFVDDSNQAYAVFDGVGGSSDPVTASSMAADLIKEALANMPAEATSEDEAKAYLTGVMQKTSTAIHQATGLSRERIEAIVAEEKTANPSASTPAYEAKRRRELAASGGRTTAAVVKLWSGEENGQQTKKAIIANLGDSRVYLQRQGRLRPSKSASGHCPLFGPPHWSQKSSYPKHLGTIWPGPKTGQRMWPKNGVFGQPRAGFAN